MHTLTWTVDQFGITGEITCTAGVDAPCRSTCEPCYERGILTCSHPQVDMGRCLAAEAIHQDEVVESYGGKSSAVVKDATVVVYQQHTDQGAWKWEYVDERITKQDQLVTASGDLVGSGSGRCSAR